MKLSLMKAFFDTVNEEWKSPIATSIATHFPIDEHLVYVYRASANFVCVGKKDDKNVFLRFNLHQDHAYLEGEIKLLLELKSKGLPIVSPLRSLNGRYIETINTSIGAMDAVLFEGLIGESFDADELNPNQLFEWGKSLGVLHQALKEVRHYPRPDSIMRLAELEFDLKDQAILNKIQTVKKALQILPITQDNYGLIHFDYECDNLVFGEVIQALDFDDACYHFFAADLVYALRDVPDDKRELFTKGYQSVCQVDGSNHELFTTYHDLYTYGRLVNACDLEVSSEHAEWLNQLIIKLTQKQKELEKRLFE